MILPVQRQIESEKQLLKNFGTKSRKETTNAAHITLNSLNFMHMKSVDKSYSFAPTFEDIVWSRVDTFKKHNL